MSAVLTGIRSICGCARRLFWIADLDEVTFAEGRRLGFDEAAIFDEIAAEIGATCRSARGRSRDRFERDGHEKGRQKPSCMLVSWSTRPRAGGDAQKSLRSRLSRSVRRSIQAKNQTVGLVNSRIGCREAEAGESPSSEAPPAIRGPEGHVTRSVERRGGPWGTRGARSGIWQRTGCSCRKSVAEVGETHLSRGLGEMRGNP